MEFEPEPFPDIPGAIDISLNKPVVGKKAVATPSTRDTPKFKMKGNELSKSASKYTRKGNLPSTPLQVG